MYLFFNQQCDMDRPICFIVTVLVAFKNRSSAKMKAAELLHNKEVYFTFHWEDCSRVVYSWCKSYRMKRWALEIGWKDGNPYDLVEKSSHTVEGQKQT